MTFIRPSRQSSRVCERLKLSCTGTYVLKSLCNGVADTVLVYAEPFMLPQAWQAAETAPCAEVEAAAGRRRSPVGHTAGPPPLPGAQGDDPRQGLHSRPKETSSSLASSWHIGAVAQNQCGCRVLQRVWERADLPKLSQPRLAIVLAASCKLPELLCHKYGNFVIVSAIMRARGDAVRAWWLDSTLPASQVRSFWSTLLVAMPGAGEQLNGSAAFFFLKAHTCASG